MNRELWNKMCSLEREVYKVKNPNWKEIVLDYDSYNYIMDEEKIKRLFHHRRIGLEIEDGEVNIRNELSINGRSILINRDGHLKIKFGHCYADFTIYNMCKELKTLEGSPKIVDGGYYIYYTDIKDLVGSPRIVKGDYYIAKCSKLESIEGLPQEVGGDLIIESKGFTFSKDYIKSVCKVGGDIILNKF